jgi:hypothetical protein
MSYEIYDYGACIKFVKDGIEFFLAKSTIKKISIIGSDTIKISTGNCLGSIFFHQRDVVAPENLIPIELVNYLNAWITENVLPPEAGSL